MEHDDHKRMTGSWNLWSFYSQAVLDCCWAELESKLAKKVFRRGYFLVKSYCKVLSPRFDVCLPLCWAWGSSAPFKVELLCARLWERILTIDQLTGKGVCLLTSSACANKRLNQLRCWVAMGFVTSPFWCLLSSIKLVKIP